MRSPRKGYARLLPGGFAERPARARAALAGEDLDFAAARDRTAGTAEGSRFAALAELERAYLEALESAGLVDPAEASRVVRRRGPDPTARVVLVGVSELGRAARALIEALPAPVTCLVAAPPEERDGLDALGTPAVDAWADRDVPLADASFEVEPRSDDVARRAARWLAELAPAPPEAFTIGALDPDLLPHLERRLLEAGVELREPQGTPAHRTPPGRLLALVADYVRTGSFEALAALVRHPDLERALSDAGFHGAPATVCDRYHRAHFPATAGGAARLDSKEGRALGALVGALETLLGGLTKERAAAPSAWTEPTRSLLAACYVELEREPRTRVGWERSKGLEAIAGALAELDALPGKRRLSAADALDLCVERLRTIPAPALPREGAVEALGWLELALDEAPHLFAAGFNEGRVPRAASEPFLSDTLRERLGLPTDRARLARDVFLLTVILGSRPDARFVARRTSREGDPLRPSRLAFHAPPEVAVRRVQRYFGEGEAPRAPAAGADGSFRPPFRAVDPPETLSVSAFGEYLRSPYQFYLRYVLRLEPEDDRDRELPPNAFGALAHDVLEALGRSDARDGTDADAVAAWLSSSLDGLVRERYGRGAQPAIRVQVEALRRRLRAFAEWHAASARAGWRVHAVEHVPDFALEVDGAPMPVRGRIDRVDRHADGRWRIIDYKTGDAGKKPEAVHRRGRKDEKEWIDLQLPLYREMVRPETGDEATVELGYVLLPKSEEQIGFEAVDWGPELFEEAMERAAEVVRAARGMREEVLARTGARRPYEDVFAAIEGRGLVGAEADDDEDGGEP